MLVRIIETGELKDLSIYNENGIEWTADLVGDDDNIIWNRETDEHECSQETYEWWSEYIKNHEADEQEVMELAKELGIEASEIWERINQNLNCDLGDEHMIIQNVLEEIRKEA